MKWGRVVSFIVMFLMLLSGCGTSWGPLDGEQTLQVLTIGTADSGGTMYPVGAAIAQVIAGDNSEIKVNLSASSGSAMNVRALDSGEVDLALVSGDVAYSAVHGQDEFDTPVEGLRAVAAVYTSISNWIAPESTGAEYVHDLMGMRIGVGPIESTTELSARTAIEVLGLDQEGTEQVNCSLGGGAKMVDQGELDAAHGFTGIPIGSFAQLARERPCRILKYTEEELSQIISRSAFYYATVIPAGTYQGQEEDVATFGVKCLLCVDAEMSEELVYEIAETLYESRGEMGEYHASLRDMAQGEFLCQDIPIDLHPGAEQFYREAGLLE